MLAAGLLIGGIIGGALTAFLGGSFWEGFEDGAFGGALGGLLFGGMGYFYTQGKTALTFAQLMKTSGAVGGSVSLIGDIGDVLIKGEDISLGQIIQHAAVSVVLSMALSAAFYGIGKAFRALWPKAGAERTGGGSSAEGGSDAFDYYMDLVEKLDVSTEPNTATFYSGEGNRALAEEFARINGKVTLETTSGGAYLDSLNLFSEGSPLTYEETLNVWARLSARYAQGASGNVYGFVNGSRPESIFNTVEYPELLNNPSVINIFTEFMK